MKNNTILIIILPIVLGFLSGIVGYSLFLNNGNLLFSSRLDLADSNRDGKIIIEQPRSVIVSQDVRIRQIESDLLPAMVNVYYDKDASQTLNKIYLLSEALGSGFVLTADGWTITTDKAVTNHNFKYAVVGYQGKEYELANFVEDSATGFVFGQIEADNLPVAKLGRSSKLAVGQTVAVLSKRNNLTLANIKKIGYEFSSRSSVVQSSEVFNKRIFLDIELDKFYEGAVVANLKGEIVGLVRSSQVIPIDQIRAVISQVLEKQDISRPALGIRYVDLSQVEGLSELGDKGALIYGQVSRLSPAYGKLQTGDIIKKVDDVEVSVYWSLSELIQDYQPGEVIELLVEREEKELTVEIELGQTSNIYSSVEN